MGGLASFCCPALSQQAWTHELHAFTSHAPHTHTQPTIPPHPCVQAARLDDLQRQVEQLEQQLAVQVRGCVILLLGNWLCGLRVVGGSGRRCRRRCVAGVAALAVWVCVQAMAGHWGLCSV